MSDNNPASRRARVLTRHLTSAAAADNGGSTETKAPNWFSSDENALIGDIEKMSKFVDMLYNDTEGLEYNIADHLAGPFNDKERFPNGWKDIFFDFREYQLKGENHLRIAEYQRMYGGDQGMAANIVIPQLAFGRDGPNDSGPRSFPYASQEVIIAHPADAQRIARMHVKKQQNFTPMFYNSIISTTDQEEWKTQREHIVQAFMPRASLERIFPVTLARAKECTKRLEEMRQTEKSDKTVNINEFMLFETEAQLQLALFGMSPEFMEDTNVKFRQSMSGAIEPMYARQFCDRLVGEMKSGDFVAPKAATCPFAQGKVGTVEEASASCPVKGPLSAMLSSAGVQGKAEHGNAFIFAFAGHDTTGHTLTWLVFELCRNPDVQAKLQEEVDEFFRQLGDEEMTYRDLTKLPYMTKCIMETLRMYPAVANGTFREIQFDDTITGPNGEDVKVLKGTKVRVVNWSRHRNPDLWGPDVNEFNPDRDWKSEELWNGDVLRAYNPQSDRFSPFTFTPRDCIGKNFSHMEMRAILVHVLRDFSFELSKEAATFDPATFLGVNYGTMGPQDLSQPDMVKSKPGWGPPERRPMGLRVLPIPRR